MKLKSFYVRPSHMAKTGDRYWPKGPIGVNLDPSKLLDIRFTDQDGKEFFISYSESQVEAMVNEVGCFQPYIPMLIIGVLEWD